MISPAESKPQLAKYALHEEIGHGGMATVYRATDRRLGREVAVKIIHKHLRENPEVAARFASEARAVAKLRHPGIVEVFDVSDENEDERYLVVELVRGTTLRKLLLKLGHFPAEVAAAIGLELAAALAHAHERGVIHRDVKPENVLVEVPRGPIGTSDSRECPASDREPKVMITDFGIAKLLDAQGVTSTGQVLGSPAHMAPEQIEGGKVGPRSDVFALAVLLYECMVGHLPFEGKNPAQVLRRVLDGTYPPAERERPTVGAGWSRVLDRALENDAEHRYESVEAFADAMRAELDSHGFDAHRRELAEFLADPEAYRGPYEERLVQRLVARGERARAKGDIPLAAAAFNRALAFRPSDPEIVARVTRLARGQRLKEMARRVASVTGVAVLLGGTAYAVTRAASRPRTPDRAPSEGSARHPRASDVKLVGAEPAARSTARSASSSDPRRRPKLRSAKGRAPTRPSARHSGTGEMRKVVVDVTPPNAIVELDGRPLDPWFGVATPLEIGTTHVFAFSPPEAERCCDASQVTFTVRSGEGTQVVRGAMKFRKAVLRVGRGPEGMVALCGKLTGGAELSPGQAFSQKMPALKVTGTCTLTAPGSPPKVKTVTLRAGETVQLSW